MDCEIMDIPFPRGARDLMPNEALFRNEVLKKIEVIFQRFGFLAIDTPTFESLKLLKAKNAIGEESKLIYELKDEELGLRYDNTVSLARYIGMHQELALPFRRYYIGKCWRREEPQRLRYREFTQADVDIVGGSKAMADAEIIAAGAAALDGINISYYIDVNDRRVFEKVLEKFGANKELFIQIERIIDKLDKAGEASVVAMLKDLKLSNELIDQIISFIGIKGTNDEKIGYVENLLKNKESTKDFRTTLELLKLYNIKGDVRVNLSLMRGLDYYTDIVFEYKVDKSGSGSVGGGGRYDSLIGLYSGKHVPAVGLALGIDRILEHLGYSEPLEYTYAKAFVGFVKDTNYQYAVKTATQLRAQSIPTELNVASRNLSNQLSYASSLKIKYMIIVGDAEEKLNKVKLRNLVSGEESVMDISDAVKAIKGA